jgi:hypothetical protein
MEGHSFEQQNGWMGSPFEDRTVTFTRRRSLSSRCPLLTLLRGIERWTSAAPSRRCCNRSVRSERWLRLVAGLAGRHRGEAARVRNAPWRGPVEGQVNRLKTIKYQDVWRAASSSSASDSLDSL